MIHKRDGLEYGLGYGERHREIARGDGEGVEVKIPGGWLATVEGGSWRWGLTGGGE